MRKEQEKESDHCSSANRENFGGSAGAKYRAGLSPAGPCTRGWHSILSGSSMRFGGAAVTQTLQGGDDGAVAILLPRFLSASRIALPTRAGLAPWPAPC